MKKEFFDFYNTYKLYIFPGVVALSCLILIIFVILPQINLLIGNSKSEKDMFSKFKLMEVKANDLQAFDENKLNQDLSVALAVYPTERDYAQVLGLLQRIAGSFGYTVLSAQLGQAGDKSSSTAYSIKLEIFGTRTNFAKMLSVIENSPRVLRVSGVDLGSKGGTDSLVGTVNIDIYYSTVPTNLGNIDTPLPHLSDKEQALLSSLSQSTSTGNFVQPSVTSTRGKVDIFQ